MCLVTFHGDGVEMLSKAAYGERREERANGRNGDHERALETRAGTGDLKISKLRSGSNFPDFIEPRRSAEKALTAGIQEAYIKVFPRARSTSWSRQGHERCNEEPSISPVRRDRRARATFLLQRLIECDGPYA